MAGLDETLLNHIDANNMIIGEWGLGTHALRREIAPIALNTLLADATR